MQGALCGTRSRVSRITPQAAGSAKPLHHRGYFAIQKEPAMLCGQNPEQSNRNHHEDERRKEKWREREEKEVEVEEKLEEEEEKEEQCPRERLVSKPLMDTLWAMFKLNKCPTRGDRQSLAFAFNMTVEQINQWFHKRRRRYNKDMYKQKYKKISKRC
ncbi:unnamed protein product [Nyctereutes procyonoides]|uniref:(raccoon dog) hypothetical protein n=1 Tax=Nyctereutes procyonoides TaxID=34880 RepID=A0A811XQ54_NYCPR|nr:unnamed protein product [Nyctereutes procyonoides]